MVAEKGFMELLGYLQTNFILAKKYSEESIYDFHLTGFRPASPDISSLQP
jgi:hypothetical protein